MKIFDATGVFLRQYRYPLSLAVLSGALTGSAFPPVNFPWLSLVGLIPLLMAQGHAKSLRSAALYGFTAGLIAGLIATWPLSTAEAWSGWAVVTSEQLAAATIYRWWFLHGIWLLLGLSVGIFWAFFAMALYWCPRRNRPLNIALLAPVLWVLLEWLRVQITMGYQWMMLGDRLTSLPWLAQSAAYGGVWLLSAIVVAINAAIYIMICYRNIARFWLPPAVIGIMLVILATAGAYRINRLETPQPGVGVAAIQFSKGINTLRDYTKFGMDKHYLRFIQQAYERFSKRFDILILPESVGFGSMSLDQSVSTLLPEKRTSNIKQWSEAFKPLTKDAPTALILGMDTIEKGNDYNSIIIWTKDGPVGRYHKRQLVPFAEYKPDISRFFSPSGKSIYKAGTGAQLLELGGLQAGFFICQEVLFAGLIRDSVLQGAEVLFSSGNDGVFSSPAVADVNDNAARIRAIEAGRFIVRAMKTGRSAVITPTGKEIAYAETGKNGIIFSRISPLTELTPYVRYGDWLPILFAAILMLWLLRNSANIKSNGKTADNNSTDNT